MPSRLGLFLEKLQYRSSQRCLEGDGASYTYAHLLDEVERWRLRFDELGISPGSVIGLRADYSLSAVAAILALLIRHAVAALIPRDGDTAQHLAEARVSWHIELTISGTYQWRAIANQMSHPLLERLRAADEGGIVMFTSGSTGRPKAALQSVERFLYKFSRPGRPFRTLAFLMLDHVAGMDTLFYTLINGGTLILTRRRDPRSILELIEQQKVEVLPTSPSFLRLLCAARTAMKYDVSSLKVISYGSELMDSATLSRVNANFPNVQITQKYGTTETGSPRTVSRDNNSLWLKIKSDGGVEPKVVNDILWIRSEGTILGYLNAPSPIDEEGWYCTGDLVDVDGEWIRFRGRATDIISVGGEKVAPGEVEQCILELDFVCDAVVWGETHALMGQTVTARVALAEVAPGPKEAIKLIRLHCRHRLASYKVPVRVEVVDYGLANLRQKAQRRL